MGPLAMELPQGHRTLTSTLADSFNFFLVFTLCPGSTWFLGAATEFAGSCSFLETVRKNQQYDKT
jgi:hypothetical protein